ncbi:hypothetical protein SLS62_000966 [Diatrype stigma]|uniref:Nudix hydrolase domain-containing protein n=1 Tax=Diatrype stigma TaxID=117547 RepID=A0AAN9YX23_9PEZI
METQKKKTAPAAPEEPRPSASIILLSPTNQVLLLHRVKTSSAFPSAHVFPGGNLSDYHDVEVGGAGLPPPGDPARHEDSLAYRLAAIRETFEESGILLARDTRRDGRGSAILNLPTEKRDEGRRLVYENRTRFVEWVKGEGGEVDTENLLPFTRWITPTTMLKRFSTQMYIYMLPLSSSPPSPSSPGSSSSSGDIEEDPTMSEAARSEALIPTPDGGVEHTAARFDEAAAWLEKQRRGEIVMFPPQVFLLHLLSQFLTGPPAPSSPSNTAALQHQYYAAQRDQLRRFLETVPTTTIADPRAAGHPTAQVPWARKAISPATLGVRQSDRRSILVLDRPGPELRGTGRGGVWEKVVLVRFEKGGGVRDVEVRGREEVLAEEREAAARKQGGRGGDGNGTGLKL